MQDHPAGASFSLSWVARRAVSKVRYSLPPPVPFPRNPHRYMDDKGSRWPERPVTTLEKIP